MGKVSQTIEDGVAAWIAEQPIFFVSSAPSGSGGHINCSPKGLDSFRVLSPDRVAYLDLTGSGNETAAHLAANGRITIMFCAFEGAPRILRLYGRGHVALPEDAEFNELAPHFDVITGQRQLIVIDVDRVQISCGTGVPKMELVEQRGELVKWAELKGPEGLAAYRRTKNAHSLDGLPTEFADD